MYRKVVVDVSVEACSVANGESCVRIEGLKSLCILCRFFGMWRSAAVIMSVCSCSMALSISVWCLPSSCVGLWMSVSVSLKSSQFVDL